MSPKRRRSSTRSLPAFYNRTVFRSRTEARWAVFWDELAIRWEYEPEGFALSDGTRYLPDFWLPDMLCWAEVKSESGPNARERRKAVLLAEESARAVLLLCGAPWPRVYELLQRIECQDQSDVTAFPVTWDSKYTGTRDTPPHDLRPRMFFDDVVWPDEEVESAMSKARAAELMEPPPEAYETLDLGGTPIMDGEDWETGAQDEGAAGGEVA